jgi:hypothetical protein
MTNATHIVSRDGIARYIGTESQCWQWLHDASPASIDHATTHEGWRLEALLSLVVNSIAQAHEGWRLEALPTWASLDDFTTQYVETALWSSTDDKGAPLDGFYTPNEIDPAGLWSMVQDCANFQAAHADDLAEWDDDSQAGHDYWLTRNRHGAGFWDRGRGALGDRLADAAKADGSCDLYVADLGVTIYVAGAEYHHMR